MPQGDRASTIVWVKRHEHAYVTKFLLRSAQFPGVGKHDVPCYSSLSLVTVQNSVVADQTAWATGPGILEALWSRPLRWRRLAACLIYPGTRPSPWFILPNVIDQSMKFIISVPHCRLDFTVSSSIQI